MLVGSRQDVDARLLWMAPGLIDPQEVVVRAFPPGRKCHTCSTLEAGVVCVLRDNMLTLISGESAWEYFLLE